MSRVTLPPVVPLLVLSGLYLISLGCGGLPSGKLPLPTPPNGSAGAVSVSISPKTAALGAGNSLQFTATSSGLPTADLEWLANGVPGGNSATGTISRSGLYTAPQQVTSNAEIVIAVSSETAPAKGSTATVTVMPGLTPITVSLAPGVASLYTSQAQQFTATVKGTTNQGVSWFVNGNQGGTPSIGTISSAGMYSAPLQVASDLVVTISAKSRYNPDAIAEASVTVLRSPAPPAAAQNDPLNSAYRPTVDCNPADYPSNISLSGSLVKLREDSDSPGGVYGAGPCITIYAMQNEFQSFQVHVQAPGGGYSALNINMSALAKSTGPGGNFTIPAPSTSETNIVVYKELYMDVTIKSGSSATFYNSTGYYPDALLPAIDPYYHQTTNAFPVSVTAGQNQSTWVDILVPKTAPSGWYSGTVTISNRGTTLATMPVLLGVWQWPSTSGGYMPSTASLRSDTVVSYDGGCYQMFGSLSACSYGGQTEVAATRLIKEDATTLLLDNRYSNGSGLSIIYPCNSLGTCGSLSTWDSNYAPFLNGTNAHVTGLLQGAKLTAFDMNSVLPGSLSSEGGTFVAFQNHFSSNGWTGLFYYLCDEPASVGSETNIRTCISNGNREHSYTTTPIPNLVTANYPFVSGYTGGTTAIDWLVSNITDLEPPGGPLENLSQYTSWVSAEPATREWWSYLSCTSAGTCSNGTTGSTQYTFPNYDIDGQPVANRAMEWITFLHGQTAELYYASDVCAASNYSPAGNCGVYGGGAGTSPFNPLISDYYAGGWGDGTLIYYTGVAYNAGTTIPLILPSTRLKMIRDGMQDYEYLNLLTKLGKSSFVQSEISSWVTNTYTFNVNPSGLSGARQSLGETIHQLTYPVTRNP